MTQPAPGSAPTKKSKLPLILGLLVIVLLAGGAYFLFADRSERALPNVEQSGSLVEAPAPTVDLQAFLDRQLSAEQKQGLSYRVEGNRLLDVVLKDGDEIRMTAGEVEFRALDSENPQPHFLDVRIKNMEIFPPAGSLPEGTGPLKGSAVYAYSYDQATRTLELPAIQLTLDGLATLGLTGTFSEMDIASASPDEALSGVAGSKINSFAFELKDEKLLPMLLQGTAESQGMDLATMKNQGIAMLAVLESQVSGSIEKQTLAAARTILTKEGVTLKISANPAQPFPVATFALVGQTAGGLPDLSALEPLNLTITAE